MSDKSIRPRSKRPRRPKSPAEWDGAVELTEAEMDQLIRKEAKRLEQIIIRAIMKAKQRS